MLNAEEEKALGRILESNSEQIMNLTEALKIMSEVIRGMNEQIKNIEKKVNMIMKVSDN